MLLCIPIGKDFKRQLQGRAHDAAVSVPSEDNESYAVVPAPNLRVTRMGQEKIGIEFSQVLLG